MKRSILTFRSCCVAVMAVSTPGRGQDRDR